MIAGTVNDQRLNLRARARLGTVLRGKYRLDAVLGIGGMAVVYRATHRNRAVLAVKMLHAELCGDEDIRTRFLREAYVANTVKHPGAVTVVDDDVAEDGSAFLVMELLDGASAEDLVNGGDGKLSADVAIAICAQMLDVLAAAHEKHILHRDIKPANIFVTRDGTVKLLDFGIAKVRDMTEVSVRATRTGMTFGTPSFMAPEQARGDTLEVDERTDVWAAGATLFGMITGTTVHEGENAAQITVKAATTPARSVRQVEPSVPPALADVVDKALAFAREARWSSANEMRDALGPAPPKIVLAELVEAHMMKQRAARAESGPEETRRAGATTAQPVSSNHRARRVRASRVVVGVMTGTVVLGVGLVAIMTTARSRPRAGADLPVSLSAVATTPATTSTASATFVVPTVTASIMATSSAKPPRVPVAHPTAKPASSSRRNCNPNYIVDSHGDRHFKTECFE